MIRISRAQARRFLLLRHGLLGEKQFAGQEGLLAFTAQCGCVQFDPINVCGQNAFLTYQSRTTGFSADVLDGALYQARVLMDYFDKNLAILPTTDWPHLTRTRRKFQAGGRSRAQIDAVRPQILRQLADMPFASSDDLNLREKVDWPWGKTTLARAALEQLYFEGELVIDHKLGARKYYALAKNRIPAALLNAPDPYPDDFSYRCAQVVRRIGAVGLLGDGASDAFLCIDGLKGASRREVFEHLCACGQICPITVEGFARPLYLRTRDLPVLEAANAPLQPRTELLAPLDPLLWNRRLIARIFDFDYKWEIYTPAAQRRYGYYVLPVLQGDRLVSRVEPVLDKKQKILRLKGRWDEPGAAIDEGAFSDSLARLAQSLGGTFL